MITTTLSLPAARPPCPLPDPRPHRGRFGFTLVEVLIGSTLSVFILAGVMSTFLFLARSGMNVQHYNDMESQARQALEVFAEDVRQASAIVWADAAHLTLTVNNQLVTYGHDSTQKTFFRTGPVPPVPPSTTPTMRTRVLLTGITSFQFKGYTITGVELTDFSTTVARATAGRSTKQLQISLEAARTSQTVVAATNTVLSARFILRNKIVTV